jgi:hypothetical protein
VKQEFNPTPRLGYQAGGYAAATKMKSSNCTDFSLSQRSRLRVCPLALDFTGQVEMGRQEGRLNLVCLFSSEQGDGKVSKIQASLENSLFSS